jgi:hypothetical protein
LVITYEKNCLFGTLSDGDVRKAILKGAATGDSITRPFIRILRVAFMAFLFCLGDFRFDV